MSAATNQATIDTLISDLASSDLGTRQRAHQALMAIGKPATPYLIRAMNSKHDQTRWEAVKALDEMADPPCSKQALASNVQPGHQVAIRSLFGIVVGPPACHQPLRGMDRQRSGTLGIECRSDDVSNELRLT